MSDAVPDAAGHRSRLRRRLLDHGGETLSDHEVIEYLLALAIPRRDTKPLAKALLREFGGLAPLLAATPAQTMRVAGMGEGAAAALRIVDAAALRLLRQRAKEGPVLASWQALLDYLQADMAHIGIERVRLLHLDTKNRLIRDELVAEGSTDQATVHIRELLRRAIELGSASLILVHNHPSGDPSPSRQDIALTKEIAAAAKPLGIVLHDHIVIGTTGHASLKALGVF
ncbi:RadC family protein [Sphingomonas sp.]|uniref:RadC family protein n=1 Tax=Sphingomonas sp. TaxID=28214 RepID=UPI003B00E668